LPDEERPVIGRFLDDLAALVGRYAKPPAEQD